LPNCEFVYVPRDDLGDLFIRSSRAGLCEPRVPRQRKPQHGLAEVRRFIADHQPLCQRHAVSVVRRNGVDLITCDDDGKIVSFKVMIRPKKAVEAVHAQMAAMLQAMSKGAE
jgi:hypothetical protein